MGIFYSLSGTGCNLRSRKEKVEDVVSICVISLILLLLLIINVTGAL